MSGRSELYEVDVGVSAYVGELGSGKSYHAVRTIVRHLSRGGCVSTNVELNWPEVERYCAREYGVRVKRHQYSLISESSLSSFHNVVGVAKHGAREIVLLLVLDEWHLYANCRDFARADRELIAYLTQVRKLGTAVIFITQDEANIDKMHRRMIATVYRHRNMTGQRILGLKWPFRQFLVSRWDSRGLRSGSHFLPIDSEIFGLYKTDQRFLNYDSELKLEKVELDKVGIAERLRGKLGKYGWKELGMYKWIMLALIVVVAVNGYRVHSRRKVASVEAQQASAMAKKSAPAVVERQRRMTTHVVVEASNGRWEGIGYDDGGGLTWSRVDL